MVKLYTGCYRLEVNGEVFAQIKKVGRGWLVEVRTVRSGELVRYMGSWRTLAEAQNEVTGGF